MLLSQYYNSINSIDSEFIAPLANLLSNEIVSFSNLEQFELNTDENVRFIYYLFFCNKHNVPVGFLQLMLHPEEIPHKKSFFSNFMSKNTVEEKSFFLEALIPGINGISYYFDPEFKESGEQKIRQIISDMRSKRKIIGEKWNLLSDQDRETISGENLSLQDERISSFRLDPNTRSYGEYFQSIKQELGDEIKSKWGRIINDRNYTITEYQDFKSIFRNKNNGTETYNQLRKDTDLKDIIRQDNIYLTIEKHDDVSGIITLTQGSNGHYFCNFFVGLSIDDQISPLIFIQYAIMRFLELENANSLHFTSKISTIMAENASALEDMNIHPVWTTSITQSNYKSPDCPLSSSRARIAS